MPFQHVGIDLNLQSLQGIAIGNGLTQPDIQYGAYADYAYDNHLISKMTYEGLRVKYPVCAMAIHACGTKGSISCIAALYICQTIVVRILAEANNINVRICSLIPKAEQECFRWIC